MKKLFLFLILTCAIPISATAANFHAIEFSEINLKNTTADWIELKINSNPDEKVIIKDDGKIAEINTEQIKNNKYILIHFKSENEFTKEANNTLHIYSKKSGLTGTTEQVTIQQGESIIDAICWQNSTPTQSEQVDMDTLKLKKLWNGACLDSEKIKKNESIIKTQSKNDESSWTILSHPTPGEENIFKNQAPVTKINIQKPQGYGTNPQIIKAETPFSINLDGSKSFDPDGDSISYIWELPDKQSTQKNPQSFKITISGEYMISLTVKDAFNASSTETITIQALSRKEEQESKDLIASIIKKTKNALPPPQRDKQSPSPQISLLLILAVTTSTILIKLY